MYHSVHQVFTLLKLGIILDDLLGHRSQVSRRVEDHLLFVIILLLCWDGFVQIKELNLLYLTRWCDRPIAGHTHACRSNGKAEVLA